MLFFGGFQASKKQIKSILPGTDLLCFPFSLTWRKKYVLFLDVQSQFSPELPAKFLTARSQSSVFSTWKPPNIAFRTPGNGDLLGSKANGKICKFGWFVLLFKLVFLQNYLQGFSVKFSIDILFSVEGYCFLPLEASWIKNSKKNRFVIVSLHVKKCSNYFSPKLAAGLPLGKGHFTVLYLQKVLEKNISGFVLCLIMPRYA